MSNHVLTQPERHEKGWGYELWITNSPRYCGKILVIRDGKKCSFHCHREKHETFYLEQGRLILRYGESLDIHHATEVVMNCGDVFEVPPGLYHQMEALEEVRLVEVSTQHFEHDSHRVVRGD